MPDIVLSNLTRRFGATTAVDDISVTFPEGSVTCLLGPSGCGKTTLMRMIAGLERPSGGTIRFGARDVTGLPAGRRDVAMVFQYPVMYRTLTVGENIELPLRNDRSLKAAERRARVEEVLGVLELGPVRDHRIGRLDMGTRQKVAVGRAIARRCDIVLFDEPTTNVEVHAKLQLIRAFNEFRARLRQTIVYVTHDQTEAMTLADQVALMQAGVISQCAPPQTLYDAPASEFGGWFLGSPGMNFLEPTGGDAAGLAFDVLPERLPAPGGGAANIRLGIRPEHVLVHAGGDAPGVPARILRRAIATGGVYVVTLQVGASRLRARVDPDRGRDLPDAVRVECPPEHVALFRDGARLR